MVAPHNPDEYIANRKAQKSWTLNPRGLLEYQIETYQDIECISTDEHVNLKVELITWLNWPTMKSDECR